MVQRGQGKRTINLHEQAPHQDHPCRQRYQARGRPKNNPQNVVHRGATNQRKMADGATIQEFPLVETFCQCKP